jgi:septum site-determining protein MinC
MLRGTSGGLEFVFGGEAFEQTAADLRARLAERADFYRGSSASAVFSGDVPDGHAFAEFVAAVRDCGIELRGLYGPEPFSEFATRHALAYLGVPSRPVAVRVRRIERAPETQEADVSLTDAARSLEADFAGARADLAARRVRRAVRFAPLPSPPPVAAVEAVATRYHRGTVRGGQTLQQVGNIVVVGDVNPGAELVASGDIVVFGVLRGIAHAGAQGDRAARVAAIELAPTQLRIATHIAAGDGGARREPEEARIEGDRIVIAPLSGARR